MAREGDNLFDGNDQIDAAATDMSSRWLSMQCLDEGRTLSDNVIQTFDRAGHAARLARKLAGGSGGEPQACCANEPAGTQVDSFAGMQDS
jgi:hypothetical protein